MDKEESIKSKAAGFEGRKVVNFIGDIKQEFRKIEWTNKAELVLYTKIVLAATFIFGIGIYLVDLLIQGCLSGIQNIVKMLVG